MVVFSIISLLKFLPMSFSLAMSTLIGSALGQGNIYKAKRIIHLVTIICGSLVISIFILLNSHNVEIVKVYTSNTSIIRLASKNLRVFSYVYVVDSLYQLLLGIIKGLGI